MTTATTTTLDYAMPQRRRLPRAAVIGIVAAVVGLPVTLAFTTWVVRTALVERQLRAESQRLLLANAPQQTWPTLKDLVVPHDGRIVMPDGRLGRLAQRPPNPQSPHETPLQQLVDEKLARIVASSAGCSVVRTDPDGTPVVHIVALSPRSYGGVMCGLATTEERRRGAMKLWRNVGAMLVEDGRLPGDPHAAEPETISVLGW